MNTNTRLLPKAAAMLLCLALALSAFLLVPSAVDAGAIPLATEDDLQRLYDDPAGSYVLTADITLTEAWTPIPKFSGTLDGNGFAIRGLNIVDAADTNWSNSGFIESLEGGTVRNLAMYGSIANNVAGHSVQLGTFAGQVKNGTLENCTSYVSFTTGNASGNVYVGGLVGIVSKGTKITVTNCAYYGEISATCANLKSTNVGGLVGAVSGSGDFINSANYGRVNGTATSNGYGQVGGLVGTTETVANGCALSFVNCRNAGDVTANGFTGGLVGICKGSITLTDCVNYGDVTDGSAYAAGMLAQAQGVVNMTHCVNLGDVTVTGRYLSGLIANTTNTADCTVRYCATVGTLNGTYANTDDQFYGGLLGRGQAPTSVFANCLSLGAITYESPKDTYVGGIGGSEGKGSFENCFTTYEKLHGYGNGGGSNAGSAVITDESDLAAIVEVLNSGAEAPMFRLNNGAVEPVYELNAVSTTVIGTQTSQVRDGKYSVRFVAAVNSLQYSEAGFRISAVITDENGDTVTVEEKSYNVSTVYKTLIANADGGIELLEAPCGTYYMALSLNNIPEGVAVTFTVTSFVNNGEATAVGDPVALSFANGKVA